MDFGAAVRAAIRIDVTEDDKAYHVQAELPGVKEEAIAVEIDSNQVCLTARRNPAAGG